MTAGLLLALGLIATFPSSANGSRVGNRSHSRVGGSRNHNMVCDSHIRSRNSHDGNVAGRIGGSRQPS